MIYAVIITMTLAGMAFTISGRGRRMSDDQSTAVGAAWSLVMFCVVLAWAARTGAR